MAMAGDMGGMQEEMKSRTVFMTREMQRYQLAAASTATVRPLARSSLCGM